MPIEILHDIRKSALEQLGYGQKGAPLVQINNGPVDNRVQIAVGAAALTEAREALRTAERLRAAEPAQLVPPAHQIEAGYEVASQSPASPLGGQEPQHRLELRQPASREDEDSESWPLAVGSAS